MSTSNLKNPIVIRQGVTQGLDGQLWPLIDNSVVDPQNRLSKELLKLKIFPIRMKNVNSKFTIIFYKWFQRVYKSKSYRKHHRRLRKNLKVFLRKGKRQKKYANLFKIDSQYRLLNKKNIKPYFYANRIKKRRNLAVRKEKNFLKLFLKFPQKYAKKKVHQSKKQKFSDNRNVIDADFKVVKTVAVSPRNKRGGKSNARLKKKQLTKLKKKFYIKRLNALFWFKDKKLASTPFWILQKLYKDSRVFFQLVKKPLGRYVGPFKKRFFYNLLFKSKKKDKSVFNKKKRRKNNLLKSNEQVSWRILLLKKKRLRKKKFKSKKFRLKKNFILRINKPWRQKKKKQNFVNRFIMSHSGRRSFSKTNFFWGKKGAKTGLNQQTNYFKRSDNWKELSGKKKRRAWFFRGKQRVGFFQNKQRDTYPPQLRWLRFYGIDRKKETVKNSKTNLFTKKMLRYTRRFYSAWRKRILFFGGRRKKRRNRFIKFRNYCRYVTRYCIPGLVAWELSSIFSKTDQNGIRSISLINIFNTYKGMQKMSYWRLSQNNELGNFLRSIKFLKHSVDAVLLHLFVLTRQANSNVISYLIGVMLARNAAKKKQRSLINNLRKLQKVVITHARRYFLKLLVNPVILRIKITGKLAGSLRTRNYFIGPRHLPLHTISHPIEVTQSMVNTKYGIFTVRVWCW